MDYRKKFRVDPHAKVKLNKLDPAYAGEHESEAEAKKYAYTTSLSDRELLAPRSCGRLFRYSWSGEARTTGR